MHGSNPFDDSSVLRLVDELSRDSGDRGDTEVRVFDELQIRIRKANYAFVQSSQPGNELHGHTMDFLSALDAMRPEMTSDELRALQTQHKIAQQAMKTSTHGLRLSSQQSFYAESCYVQLWRIVERCSNNKTSWLQVLPELKNFKPLGVRNVRNHNFEHLDESSYDILERTKTTADGLEAVLPGPSDDGLRANVDEYVGDLGPRLQRIASRL